MTANRRIALNVVATYGRSLYAMVLGLFTVRWALQALGSWVCVVGVRGCRLPVGSEVKVKVKVKGEGEQRMVLFLGRMKSWGRWALVHAHSPGPMIGVVSPNG